MYTPCLSLSTPCSYDIIYKIFFHVDDYITLQHFWVLDRTCFQLFHNNVSYKHKFDVLKQNIFLYISTFSNTRTLESDVAYLEKFIGYSLKENEKNIIMKDVKFVYKLYKTFLRDIIKSYVIRQWSGHSNIGEEDVKSITSTMTNLFFIYSNHAFDSICTVQCKLNKVSLVYIMPNQDIVNFMVNSYDIQKLI
jgi:hypothetical protein